MKNPVLTVIMPVYNALPYLETSIESVLAQTLADIEILCIDDGSTDGSSDVLARYAADDPRIRIITKPNAGYGAAVNDGIDAARGTYVGIVEPDDFIEPDMYKHLTDIANKHDCDVVKSDFLPFTGENETYEDAWYEIAPCKDYYGKVFDSTKGESLFYVMMMNWTGIYRRDFLRKHKVRHNESPGAAFQDNGFWFQVFTFAKRVFVTNRAFYHYRTDNASSSINSTTVAHRITGEYAFIRRFLEADPKRWERLQYIYGYFYFDNLLARLSHLEGDALCEFKRFMARELETALDADELDLGYFPDYMVEEFMLIMKDPDAYDPAEHVSVEENAWTEMAGRRGRTGLLKDSNSPYEITSRWRECLAEG